MKTSLLHLPLAVIVAAATIAYSAEPLTGEQVYNKGRAALAKGDLVTARQCFEQLLKAKPDFELARVQLAQVVVAERELAKIPPSLKVARREILPRMELSDATIDEAAATFAKALEKAGGSGKLTVNIGGHLPDGVNQRTISLSATEASFDHVLAAIGYAGGVHFSYTAEGVAVREDRGAGRKQWDAGDPKQPDFTAAAKKLVIDRLVLQDASAAETFAYLQRKSAELSGGKIRPLFVIRHDAAPRSGVTLDLRNISLYEAVGSVCLVTDLEATWFPWGAGIGSKPAAASAAGPAGKDDAAE